MAHQPHPLAYFIPLLILLPLLYFRMRRMSRPRPLKLRYLWVRPALLIAVAALAVLVPQGGARLVLSPPGWAGLALAVAAGLAAGWQWGRTMTIEVHPADGTLMARGGQAAILVMVVLVTLRLGLKAGLAMEARAWHLDAVYLTDLSILFTAALFAARGLEMFLRARRVTAP